MLIYLSYDVNLLSLRLSAKLVIYVLPQSDDKYRCSETGYRIPFKCLKTGDVAKGTGDKGSQKSQSTQGPVNADNSEVKHRTTSDSDYKQKGESQFPRVCNV